MYDDEYTQLPRDAEHLWELARNNLELAKQVLLYPHFETEEEVITGVHRLRPDEGLALCAEVQKLVTGKLWEK